jgi:hypothetical protein
MKLSNWIQLILLTGLLFLGFYASCNEKKEIEACSEEGIASVVKIYQKIKKGYWLQYSYFVNGQRYISTKKISVERYNDLSHGDTVHIKISCTNPATSELKDKGY